MGLWWAARPENALRAGNHPKRQAGPGAARQTVHEKRRHFMLRESPAPGIPAGAARDLARVGAGTPPRREAGAQRAAVRGRRSTGNSSSSEVEQSCGVQLESANYLSRQPAPPQGSLKGNPEFCVVVRHPSPADIRSSKPRVHGPLPRFCGQPASPRHPEVPKGQCGSAMRQTGRPCALENPHRRTPKADSWHHLSRVSRALCPYSPATMGRFRFCAKPTTE